MNYLRENKPGWAGLVTSFVIMLCSLYGLSRGYVKIDTVIWWGGVTFCSAVLMTIWTYWWHRKQERKKLHRENLVDFPMYTFYHGPEEAYQTLFYKRLDQNGDPMPEYIIGSTLLYQDIVYATMAPGRHHHCIRLYAAVKKMDKGVLVTDVDDNRRDQGFITSYGRHVNRYEAFMIAVKAKQLVDKTGSISNPELFSEDIWPTTRPFAPLDWRVPEGKERVPRTDVVARIYDAFQNNPNHFETMVRGGGDIPYLEESK